MRGEQRGRTGNGARVRDRERGLPVHREQHRGSPPGSQKIDCPVHMTCSGCGFEALADFAFCPKCGARLAAAPVPPPPASTAPEGDRRPVTVLFADLAGFTALSEGLDPEDVRAIQSDLFHEMSASIERYDGFVEKFVGDAVMADFGAPRAHEDDLERSLRAALLMRERMDALNRRWERRVGRPLALHIGVNTGPVVAGRIGSAADAAYAVTGDRQHRLSPAERGARGRDPGQRRDVSARITLSRSPRARRSGSRARASRWRSAVPGLTRTRGDSGHGVHSPSPR